MPAVQEVRPLLDSEIQCEGLLLNCRPALLRRVEAAREVSNGLVPMDTPTLEQYCPNTLRACISLNDQLQLGVDECHAVPDSQELQLSEHQMRLAVLHPTQIGHPCHTIWSAAEQSWQTRGPNPERNCKGQQNCGCQRHSVAVACRADPGDELAYEYSLQGQQSYPPTQ
mmetsp:Transcript_12344/g.37051  ORF Transcript_12344/g.37051 Transcript_12344/m.37051 type:complete len:169 (+) Transcript_12344:1019-1525(+)